MFGGTDFAYILRHGNSNINKLKIYGYILLNDITILRYKFVDYFIGTHT